MPRELLLTAPRTIELAGYEDVPPGDGEIRAETTMSGVSLGTELSLYRGSTPFTSKRFDTELRLFVEDPGAAFPARLEIGRAHV